MQKPPVDLSRFRALAEHKVATSSTTVGANGGALSAELSRFVEDPNNPRTEFDEAQFKSFVEDIREHGILQPVVVVPTGEGRLMIRWGARRLRAARELGLASLPYTLQIDERQQSDFAQISENEQRSNLTPMELAQFVERMISKGMQKKDIAAKLRKGASTITHLLSLATAPTFILQLYQSGKCRQLEYLYQLRKLWEKQPKIVEKRCSTQTYIAASFIVQLKDALERQCDQKLKRPHKRRAPHKAATAELESTSAAVAMRPWLYSGRPVTIARGLLIVVAKDGAEIPIAGDALAELLLGVSHVALP